MERNQGRREAIDQMLPADCVLYDGSVTIKGSEEFKTFFDRMRGAFSDIRVTTHELLETPDMACLRWSVTMRHTGEGMGVPPTGQDVRATGITVVRSADGKISIAWQNWDTLAVLERIGARDPAPIRMTARG